MRVTITRVEQVDGRVQVEFASAVGRARAWWQGPPPAEGERRDVELDVPGTLEWGRGIVRLLDPGEDEIASLDGGVRIAGTIEAVESDGTAVVRVGASLLLLQTVGTPSAVRTRVRATAPALRLHDTGC